MKQNYVTNADNYSHINYINFKLSLNFFFLLLSHAIAIYIHNKVYFRNKEYEKHKKYK